MVEQTFNMRAVARHFGGEWCYCIDEVIQGVTPKKVAAYCIGKQYKPYPEPVEDELGIRYSYLLGKFTEEENEVLTERSLTASFGDFSHRPLETIQSCMKAIASIGIKEKRSPQDVAHDVVKADEAIVPEPRKHVSDIYEPQMNKRYQMDSTGANRAIS